MVKEYDHDFLKQVGERLAAFRKKSGISQEKLAAKLGVHRTYIGFIEQGKRNPTINNLYRITKELNISVQEFFQFPISQVAEEKTPYKVPTKKSAKKK
jgi:transcriptional regulator with XRE-family HTH domain